MSDDARVTLTENLKDTVKFFKERKTVGRIGTEHAIFIPSSLLLEEVDETNHFIDVAKHIKNKKEWGLPVYIEEYTTDDSIEGLNFVFKFSENTDFDSVINYINDNI